jgi:hypothetical protein
MASDPFEKVETAHAYRLTLDSKCQRVKENAISEDSISDLDQQFHWLGEHQVENVTINLELYSGHKFVHSCI